MGCWQHAVRTIERSLNNFALPGDRILSVNGCAVEKLSYADVVRLIQMTPDNLQLVVVPKQDDILQTVSPIFAKLCFGMRNWFQMFLAAYSQTAVLSGYRWRC